MKLLHATLCPDCEEVYDRNGQNLASPRCPSCGSTAPPFAISRVIAPLGKREESQPPQKVLVRAS